MAETASEQLRVLTRKLTEAVDSNSETKNAGIILCTVDGSQHTLRGGPRSRFLYIAPLSTISKSGSAPSTSAPQEESLWDVWDDAVYSCGGAVAMGAAIYFSGGTASIWVGAAAVNSAALCGISVGKGIANDEWKEFEEHGGGSYRTWLYVETAMQLADLFGSVKGAVTFIHKWKQAGKLAKLKKSIGNQKLTRRTLVKRIQEIDPSFQPVLKGQGYVKKASIIVKGSVVLKDAKFVSLSAARRASLIDAIGNAFGLAGADSTFKGAFDIALIIVSDN